MKMRWAATAATIAVLLAAASVLYLDTSKGGGLKVSTSTSAGAPNGLELRLSVNATDLAPGGRLQVSVSEFNTEASANNVSAANLWGLSGLSVGECGTSTYPFGAAVLRGWYDLGNVSQAEPLRVYPVVPCPLFIRLVTGYLFEPSSDSATILPASGAAPTPISANITVSGEYSGSSLTPLAPGHYTVAAGDEWGTVALLHFSVGG